MAGPLEGGAQPALVLGARSSLPARLDARAVGEVTAQLGWIFIVDAVRLLNAERADAPSPEGPPPALAGPGAFPSRWSGRTAAITSRSLRRRRRKFWLLNRRRWLFRRRFWLQRFVRRGRRRDGRFLDVSLLSHCFFVQTDFTSSSSHLIGKRDLVRLARRRGVVGQGRSLRPVQKEDGVGDHLGAVVPLPIRAIPGPGV